MLKLVSDNFSLDCVSRSTKTLPFLFSQCSVDIL